MIDERIIVIERLVANYGDEILRLCFLYLKDIHLAEDAVQETYIKIYKGYNKFMRKSSEKTWITRIAINTCKNYLRTWWFKNKSTQLPLDSSLAITSKIYDDTVINAIHSLEKKYKEIILLYYYQQFTTKEISEILSISESNVSVRLNRGREQLKKLLKGWYFDE